MTEVARISPKPTGPLLDHAQADLCVACGLCLPVCPTYKLLRDENESPRGRIALIRGLATGRLSVDKGVVEHLNRCTLCLACEKACPATVGFGPQMALVRNWLTENGFNTRPLAEKVLLKSLSSDSGVTWIGRVARFYQRNPLRRLLKKLGALRFFGLKQLDQELPEFSRSAGFNDIYVSRIDGNKRVALFTGCLQDQTDPETLPSAITLLNRLGYQVDVPRQVCCGGLHRQNGEREKAEQLARQNQTAFADHDLIVGVASGCGAVLHEHTGLAKRYQDINALLARDSLLSSIEFAPLPASVLVHEPCSHRNQLGQIESIYRLLHLIPELDVARLPGNEFCCGGAGAYSLSQPDLARQMREPKLEALARMGPRFLVTTNIGCALHFRNGLANLGVHLEVVHPVTMLARQIKASTKITGDACPKETTADMV